MEPIDVHQAFIRSDEMNLEYVPLLQVQRGLHDMPRDPARFRQYLRKMLRDDRVELPPLVMANPMAREHVTLLLDELLAVNADAHGAAAASDAAARLDDVDVDAKIGLVVVDDLHGGWTNRFDVEFNVRFSVAQYSRDSLPDWLDALWLTAPLWSSEPASLTAVQTAVATAIHRFAYVHRHGPAKTLAEMLAQEGAVMAVAGCKSPTLEADDLEYTREVLRHHLDAVDKRTMIECLFGDAAGQSLGFTPRGLSAWAGLALALHDALEYRL